MRRTKNASGSAKKQSKINKNVMLFPPLMNETCYEVIENYNTKYGKIQRYYVK